MKDAAKAPGEDMRPLCENVLLALPLLLAALPASAQDVAAFYKGKTVRLVVGIGVGSGYDINARAAGAPSAEAHPRQSDHHRAEPAGRRLADHDQPAVRRGPVRRHRDRRLVQRPADHAAAAARPARASSRPSSTGSAAPTAKPRRCMSGTPRRCRRSTISQTKEMIVGAQAPGSTQYDYPMLAQRAVRLEVQGHHRLRGDAEDPSRDGARRGARHLGQLVDAEGDQPSSGSRRRRSASWRSGRCASIPNCPTCRWSSTSPRPTSRSRRCELALARLEFGRPFFLPPNVPAERVSAHPARVRRHHEGPGIPGRGREAQDRDRSADRRAGRRR